MARVSANLISLKNFSHYPSQINTRPPCPRITTFRNEDSALDALATLGFTAGMDLVNAIS